MIRPSSAIGLIFLIGCTVAAVDSKRLPQAVPSSPCQEHTSLHKRLDVVEKKVEDAVGKLEAEVKALLENIEDTKWSLQLDNAGTTVDILEDPRNIKSHIRH